MNEQIPFQSLICVACRDPAAARERLPDLDYAIAEVAVDLNDGTQVIVPIDVRQYDIKYQGAGLSAARIYARVPCPSCGSSHGIDISAVRRAPVLELQRMPCPKCNKASCEISNGPVVHYREEKPGEAWVEVWAELRCPACGTDVPGTGRLDPGAFKFDPPDSVQPLPLRLEPRSGD